MNNDLPVFRYHADPLSTGAIEPRRIQCACCGQARGFVYVQPVYATSDLDEKLCPWCIADGSAAARLGASFSDAHPLQKAGLPQDIVDEVSLRTPGYSSWQQEEWLAHCGDACEFHGDASVEDVEDASEATRADWRQHYGTTEKQWAAATRDYEPAGDNAFYKFVCRQCSLVRLGWDCV
ncbi:CbrC family protein [Roseateles saccharophilus]|uniref:CbrC family protein n=1 Tax=Roseateles saccharophilus TaxID=304 RepID=A0A4R3UI08_ROSSA|nr:CbrC family protein [Roseateles saccharophilus]MDG0834593.1 hypothetical protein [Roseateles saccharophilus]TCU89048.1 hypothetical protein EV671_103523 [Roseateles saccharophilus]